MSVASLLTEGDLHGLVDGYLDVERTGDVQRRLSASAADRGRVEAWRDQNELIRRTFFGVDREATPMSISMLLAPAVVAPLEPARDASHDGRPQTRRPGAVAALFALLLMVAGLGGSWILLQSSQGASLTMDPVVRVASEDTSADQLGGAADTSRLALAPARRETTITDDMPTTEIPDLGAAGFRFVSAEARATEPRSIEFHYRDAASDRVVITVARTATARPGKLLTPIGLALSWHRGSNDYAIAGTIRAERLRAMAAMLKGRETSE